MLYLLLSPSETGRVRPWVWFTTAFLIFCRGSWERQNFFCVSCFQSMEIFVDILTKSICFFSPKGHFPLLRNLMYQTKEFSAEKLSLKGVRDHQCAQAVWFRCPLLPGHSREYRILAGLSPQPAFLAVHLTNSAWEKQSQVETSVQRGRWKWKSDELHPLRNTWDLKYFKFSWE